MYFGSINGQFFGSMNQKSVEFNVVWLDSPQKLPSTPLYSVHPYSFPIEYVSCRIENSIAFNFDA